MNTELITLLNVSCNIPHVFVIVCCKDSVYDVTVKEGNKEICLTLVRTTQIIREKGPTQTGFHSST